MKSFVYKMLFACCALTPAVHGFSLFDTAPPIGVPESYAMRYNAYVNVGYDDNINYSVVNKKSGGFVRFGVGASYADNESATRLSYNVRLGAQLYNDTAYGTDDRLFSDISVGARLYKALDRGSSYSCSLSLSYTPQPDYANPISRIDVQSDCLNWNLSNIYSQAIDERWSWNISLAYSGNIYGNENYYSDDRQYLSGGFGVKYKASPLTTYGITSRYSYEFREYGMDSESLYLTGDVSHALSPISSCSLSLGTQLKFIDGSSDLYPYLSASYRRQLAEGLSATAYARFSNENTDSYSRSTNSTYRSVETWRMGFDCSYAYTPRVSFLFGAYVTYADYGSSTANVGGYDRTTWAVTCGMNYNFTESLMGTLRYTHTESDDSRYGEYDRNTVSAGLNYSF